MTSERQSRFNESIANQDTIMKSKTKKKRENLTIFILLSRCKRMSSNKALDMWLKKNLQEAELKSAHNKLQQQPQQQKFNLNASTSTPTATDNNTNSNAGNHANARAAKPRQSIHATRWKSSSGEICFFSRRLGRHADACTTTTTTVNRRQPTVVPTSCTMSRRRLWLWLQ
jgi:hypothetical protein